MDLDYGHYKEKMETTLSVLANEFRRLRSGRANPSLVEEVKVSAYGSEMPLNQVATISIPEARLIVIQPFDKGTISDIERALHMADLGSAPNNDGHVIRLALPPLTEERRKELVRFASKKTEESKISIRNTRREMLDDVKAQEDGAPEDAVKRAQDKVQDMVDTYIKKLDELFEGKEKEIMEV